MYEIVAFYLFSALVIGFFSVAVLSKNALYAMSSLAGGMVFISGFFFLLDAEFLGVVQIIVYAGAVMALYAFGMIFFDTTRDVKENITAKKTIYTLGVISAFLLLAIVATPLIEGGVSSTIPIDNSIDNAQMIGRVIFTKYLVAFELTAIMLLVAMIAGIILVSKKMDETEQSTKEAK